MIRDDDNIVAISHVATSIVVGVVLVLVASFLTSCKATQQVQAQQVELVRGVELKQDSTSHRWQVRRVTLYDAGQVSQVEELEQHEQATVTQYVRDTLYINKVDTLYISKNYATPQVSNTAVKWLGITLAVTIFIAGILLYLWLKKILPKSLQG